MSTVNLVIFDIDGTLFQTACVTVPAVQQAFVAFGLTPPSSEAICSFFGRPVEDYESWLASLCPAGIAMELVDTANALELRFIREYGKLYPGTREVLSELKAGGYALALCSHGPEPDVEAVGRDHGQSVRQRLVDDQPPHVLARRQRQHVCGAKIRVQLVLR